MKIIQISDIHIAPSGMTTRGVDVRRNLTTILDDAKERGGTHLVISGDLCFDTPEMEVYQWLKEVLDGYDFVSNIIAGNHDDSRMIAATFGNLDRFCFEENELYWEDCWGGHPVLFLDSAKGDLSPKQAHWAMRRVQQAKKSPLIFMHHPPAALSVPYMDALLPRPDPNLFEGIVQNSDQAVHIFVGHYHVDKVLMSEKMVIWACPSTYYQIGQTQKEFTVDHRRSGYRMIELWSDHIICSTHYCEGYQTEETL